MSQNSQLLSLQVGEGTWEGSGSLQQCASGGFWLQRPPWGCLQLEHSGPGRGSPCSLEEAPRDQAPEGCWAQDHPIPPLRSRSPWDSSSFSSLCWVISQLFPSSPHQAKLRKVTYNKNNGYVRGAFVCHLSHSPPSRPVQSVLSVSSSDKEETEPLGGWSLPELMQPGSASGSIELVSSGSRIQILT